MDLEGFGGVLEPEATDPPLPPGSREYLRPDNPRLVELKRQYRDHPAAAASLWTDDYVSRALSLPYFRADNAYVWQMREAWLSDEVGSWFAPAPTREINYVLSAYYARHVDKMGLLARLSDDRLFGSRLVPVDDKLEVSRDLLDSVLEINFLERTLGISGREGTTVLDIGAGYGRLAHRLVEALPNIGRVLCADAVAESTFVCEHYLARRGVGGVAVATALDEVADAVSRAQVDLAVNVHSFSECPYDAVCWWLDLVRENRVPYLMIVPNTHTKLVSREPDGEFRDFSGALRERGYVTMAREPKYRGACQRFGLYPTYHHLFRLDD
ncbi:MAG: putative sugar O-methyltransferase [Thermoleophilaceae bacterium]